MTSILICGVIAAGAYCLMRWDWQRPMVARPTPAEERRAQGLIRLVDKYDADDGEVYLDRLVVQARLRQDKYRLAHYVAKEVKQKLGVLRDTPENRLVVGRVVRDTLHGIKGLRAHEIAGHAAMAQEFALIPSRR